MALVNYPVALSSTSQYFCRNRNRIAKIDGYAGNRNRISGTYLIIIMINSNNHSRASLRTSQETGALVPDSTIKGIHKAGSTPRAKTQSFAIRSFVASSANYCAIMLWPSSTWMLTFRYSRLVIICPMDSMTPVIYGMI